MAEKIKNKKAAKLTEMDVEMDSPEFQEALAALLASAGKTELPPVPDTSIPGLAIVPAKPRQIERLSVADRFPDKITSTIESSTSADRTIADWRTILTKECQVYVVDQQYIGKRFDQVHYKYMGIDEAKEVLTDNLYAILLYKYFPRLTDDALARIDEIVRGLTRNIKTFLTKISFNDVDSHFRGMMMKRVPNSAIAFSNGIFDFIKNEFIVKYDRIYIPSINNTIILYSDYIIEWNFDFDFEPLPVNITETSFADFLEIMRALDKESPNYCWELFYNMTHDVSHKPSYPRMVHLSEILGYTLIPQFLQYFVLLIGSGQNGKNSLFDGCFSSKLIPRPVSNSIDAIEKDRFITGALENACHNIFLETSAKTYTDSNMLKALTGSMYQTIENKGINKYAGIINCKYVFAGNDQRNIKFSDTTVGFRRRINVFEIYYSWDADHRFMKYGDYYRTDFSGDLHEIKDDITNIICYIYLGMYGILSATKNFTSDFKFSYNEWTDTYSDIDVEIKEFFSDVIQVKDYFEMWGDKRYLDDNHLKIAFFDDTGMNRLYKSPSVKEKVGADDYNLAIQYFLGETEIPILDSDGNEVVVTESNALQYLKSKDIYISLVYLRSLMVKKATMTKSQREFNDLFKKIYPAASYVACAQREIYVRARLIGGKLRFVDR